MSSVRKKDQTSHRFTLLDIVLKLYDHTTTLIANEKVFDRTYKDLISRIDYEASMIYHCCRTANLEYDNRIEEEARIRLKLQEEAIDHCMWLKTDIMLAQRKFHLRARKACYWNSLANDALEVVKGWHNTEKRHYKESFGL